MNLFEELVTQAIQHQPDLTTLRIVVEKELLHHEILRILNQNDLLNNLTFIGGTCLRACYGGIRLSEDLDFTGGKTFTRNSLANMGKILTDTMQEKYGLNVFVKEPIKEIKNVDTWKIKVETKPKQKHLPAQVINIDICAVPSYEKQPMLLLNPYGVETGTSGLIIQAQSREEIYADKLLAFALRSNRLKYRDLWDMLWLHQQGLKPRFELIPRKLKDRKLATKYFLELFQKRQKSLAEDTQLAAEFKKEMQRFLPPKQNKDLVNQKKLWEFIVYLVRDLGTQCNKLFENLA